MLGGASKRNIAAPRNEPVRFARFIHEVELGIETLSSAIRDLNQDREPWKERQAPRKAGDFIQGANLTRPHTSLIVAGQCKTARLKCFWGENP